mmetsp:Transcript_4980/g.8000  ORF Transcript_4980/g.8000 Transcript_4980/m.8000 type:complete len:177 (+) Transcript_4980:165-695(+)
MRRTGVTSSVRFFALLVVLILCFDVCHAFCAATALLGPLGAGFCASSGKMTLGGRKLGGLLGLDMVAEDKGLSGQGESHGRGRDFKLEDELQMRIMIERNREARENFQKVYFPIDVVVNCNRKFKMWTDKESWKEWSALNKEFQLNPYIPEDPEQYYTEKGVWLGWNYWFGQCGEE